jgi:hypothetical protein
LVGRAALVGSLVAAVLAASPATAQTPAAGRLTVHVKHVRSNSMYIEGSIQYLVVKRGGEQVLRRRISKGTHTFLTVGRYWVSSYTRVCEANCGNLDAPSYRCSRYLDLRGGDRVSMTLRVRVGRRCSIHFERT